MALTNAQKKNAEKNRKYWADREKEQLKHNITEEAEYDREIQRIYQNMLDRCQKEIDSFYGKYATAEGISIAEAKKRVSKADIAAYERKAKQYVKDKDFSPKANEEMRLYNSMMKINRLEMLKANIGLETIAGHDELEKFMAGILKGRTEDELARQAGILGKTVKNNAAKAHAIVNGSFHSGTFSDRIWQYQDLMRQDLGKLLQQGLIQGKGARAIAKDLKKYWYGNDPRTGGGATYCMERLMRTELARVQTEAQKQSFIRNGFTMYTFHCNENPSRHGTCSLCRSLDGKHLKVEDMMPGENAPPLHPHCRCSTSAYEDSDEYEAWLDHLEQGGTTEEWNKRKAAAEKATAPGVKKPAFTPAKTIKEAEEFAKQFVDDNGFGAIGVSYAGVGLDVANEVNRAMFDVYSAFDIPKLGGVAAPAKNTKLGKMVTAHAAYSPIRKSLLMDRNKTKKASMMLDGLMADKKAITDILTHPERYDLSKVSKRLGKVIEASKQSGRSIVPETIPEAITHELGHHIEKSVSKEDWDTIKTGMDKYATKVSGYCVDSASEYFAESFASYMKGEDCIDPELRKIFDRMRK